MILRIPEPDLGRITLPSWLSLLRLALAPVLLALAWVGWAELFFGAFVFALSTDALDGFLARRLGQCTRLGTQLDSWADLATWSVLPFCAYWLRPEAVRAEALPIALAVASAVLATGVGFLRYRRLTSYHTWGAKSAAVLLTGALVLLFAAGMHLPLRAALGVLVLVSLEEIAITATLPDWRSDVPSWLHARRLRWAPPAAEDETA